MSKYVSIDDIATSRAGKECSTGEDFSNVGLSLIGGCEGCGATIAAYNAYPSKSGYWRCYDCIEGYGFSSVYDFEKWIKEDK